jgi:uncharacterized protein YbaR (Trm112 family)
MECAPHPRQVLLRIRAIATIRIGMNPALLSLLRCPVTRQPLRLVPAAEAATLGIDGGSVLLREDGRVYYQFEENGFPQLLPGTGHEMRRDGGEVP